VVGFTREDAERIQSADSLNAFTETSRGAMRKEPEAGGFFDMYSAALASSSSDMPQDFGYRITEAACTSLKEIEESYPPCRGHDPVRDAFRNTPAGEGFCFHAGLVRYAAEIGMDVPGRCIPPEYREPGKVLK